MSRTLSIFKNCTDEFIDKFLSLAQPAKLKAGEVILNQGQINERFLILISGSVEVRVNNELVARLDNSGDLMGEMSALTGRMITASLKAASDIEFLEISAFRLRDEIRIGKEKFGFEFYTMLAHTLSDKIIRTNQKARQFEIANRALADINQKLDSKVRERTRALGVVVAELQASLKPLGENLASLENTTNAELVATVKAQVQSAEARLKPLSEIYLTELAMSTEKLLLIEPDRKQQGIARLAIGGTGIHMDIAASEDEARMLMKDNKYTLFFVALELAVLLPEIRCQFPDARFAVMGAGAASEQLSILKKYSDQIKTLVARRPDDRTFTAKNVSTTLNKLVSKDLFGIEKYLMLGIDVKVKAITCSDDRSTLAEEMETYFSGLGVRSTMLDRVRIVAEELMMNAIYDAPLDGFGKPIFNHLPRTETVDLERDQWGEFRFACDGTLAAISVADPFGGFQLQTLIDYLERNYNSNGESVQIAGKGGAGRGLHQIVESSDLVVFNVVDGVRTEVIAFFDLDPRAKDEAKTPAFHFFSI